MKLGDIMVKQVVTVTTQDTITRAAWLMQEYNVGSVVVMDDGFVTGILTDRDIVVRCVSKDHDTSKCLVYHHMSSPVIKESPETDIIDAARMMGDTHIKRLPVVDHGRLAGLASSSDIARSTDELIHELHDVLLGLNMSQLAHQSVR